MRYLSLFSGIEAATVAWKPLGWECVAVAEIEPFPCAALTHHYPGVPNLGNITEITQAQIEALGHIDVVVLGFPCQDVSIAGQRKGLKHADGTLTRTGLFYTALDIIQWSKARWTIGENVPGLFSQDEGRAFAAVVGELAGTELDVPADGWRNAGVALGDRGLVEWFVLDAQFTRVATHPRAVPQRRRRVFIIRDTGDWQRRPPVFLERQSLRRNPAPRRDTRERPAPTLEARTNGGGAGWGTDFMTGGGLASVSPTIGGCSNGGGANGPGRDVDSCETLQVQCGPIVPQAMSRKWSKGSSGPAGDEVRDLVAHSLAGFADYRGDTPTLRAEGGDVGGGSEALVTHSLTVEGFDASEDGSGRATPVVAVHARQDPIHSTGAPLPLDTDGSSQAIAFSCKDHGGDATAECAPTLRGMGHDETHANGGGQIAVAMQAGDTRENPASGPDGIGVRTDGAAFTLEARAEVQSVMTLAIRGRGDSHDIETREDGTSNAILTPNGGRAGMGVGAICARMAVAFSGRNRGAEPSVGREERPPLAMIEKTGAIDTVKPWNVATATAVRRLTPRECERLQGFPDDYTRLPSRLLIKLGIEPDPENPKHWVADGPRYKALGNSMAVNCMFWVGQRIAHLHTL